MHIASAFNADEVPLSQGGLVLQFETANAALPRGEFFGSCTRANGARSGLIGTYPMQFDNEDVVRNGVNLDLSIGFDQITERLAALEVAGDPLQRCTVTVQFSYTSTGTTPATMAPGSLVAISSATQRFDLILDQ